MQTIVVPIDDPTDANLAVRTAFATARRARCDVDLVHLAAAGDVAANQRMLEEAAAPFQNLARWTAAVVEGSDPVAGIVSLAAERDGIVCMPTRGRRGLSRMLFGSVAEGVVRSSSQPTLCLGPEVTQIAIPDERIEVLVCTDDSAASPVVFDGAAAFAGAIGASAVVAQVVGPDEDVGRAGSPPPRPIGDRAREHTEASAARLAEAGVPSIATVLPGRAAASLVGHARDIRAAFVVVGTTGRTGIDRVTLGSVATDIVRTAPCPVLVVPTRAGAVGS